MKTGDALCSRTEGLRCPTPGRLFRSGRVGAGLGVAAVISAAILMAGCGSRGEVEEPVPLYGDIPIQYPTDLWDADVEGETLLRVRVTETGEVDSVEVLEPSGYPAFDSAAVRGALHLQYRPARRDGRRITVWAKVPVHFTKGSTRPEESP